MIRQWSKVCFYTCIAVATLCALLVGSACQADEISSMNVVMTAQRDSTLNVTEKIIINFSEPRHGIFRVFPVKYSRLGASYIVDFHLNSIKDENNQNVPFSLGARGNDVSIKIGSENKLIEGTHTYFIDYRLRGAVNFFDGQPEIYWNFIGDQLQYGIRSAKLTLELPSSQTVNASELKTAAYLGVPNSKPSDRVAFEQVGQKLYFQAYDITPGTGLTVAVRLPVGLMVEPSPTTKLGWILIDWYPLLLMPGLTFFCLYATWRFLGNDDEPASGLCRYWEPPKELSPAEMGVLIDERADVRDVLSIVVDLAVRGYFKIVEVDKPGFWGANRDFQFERNLDADFDSSELKSFEKEMLRVLFNWRDGGDYDCVAQLSDLSEVGAIRFSLFRQLLYSTMTERGWFRENPDNVRGPYLQTAGIILILLVLLLSFSPSSMGSVILGGIFSVMVFCFFSGAMPARTLSGVLLRRQALAFIRFIENAKKEEIRVLADKDPTIFGRLLPYAMVVNAADHWAEAFEGLSVDVVAAPTWYQSSDGDLDFSPRLFVSRMSSGIDCIGTSFQAVPAIASAGMVSSGSYSSG